jgi:integration host factor subunit beta
MSRTELVLKLSEKENITAKDAKRVVDLLFDAMKEAFEKGERIEIRGFGTFTVRHYRNRRGRNPKTGQSVDVPPRRVPFFKVGKELKERVNQ